jgi:hypothetical protein
MQAARVAQLLEDVRLASEGKFVLMSEALALIRKTVGDASEEVKYGGVLFTLGKPFCGVFAYSSHVTIEFSNGASLKDEKKLLQGGGKFRRHIKLVQVQDLKQPGLVALVRSAAAALR